MTAPIMTAPIITAPIITAPIITAITRLTRPKQRYFSLGTIDRSALPIKPNYFICARIYGGRNKIGDLIPRQSQTQSTHQSPNLILINNNSTPNRPPRHRPIPPPQR
jgi:hypothetical protein